MKRYCQTLDLKEDEQLIKEYCYWHSPEHIWPEIPEGIRAVGILNMEIYRLGTRLFMIVETPDDFDWDAAFARLATMDKQAEWEDFVAIGVVNSVPTAWGEPLEIFQHIYEHEVHVSGSIDKIVDIASEEKDKATQDFLWGFVREQVEEEATAKNIVEKLKLYGEHHAVLMDHRLGKR